jgi:hypothetical protein
MYFDSLTQAALAANDLTTPEITATTSKDQRNAKTPTPTSTTTAPACSSSNTSGVTTPSEGVSTPETIEAPEETEKKIASYLWAIR